MRTQTEVVIEIVDSAAKIEAFLREIAGMIGSGLAVVEAVETIRFGQNKNS